MTDRIYEPMIGSDGKWYPCGPGEGFSYYSGTLYPNRRFDTLEEAEKTCLMMAAAYRAGINAQRDAVWRALGL